MARRPAFSSGIRRMASLAGAQDLDTGECRVLLALMGHASLRTGLAWPGRAQVAKLAAIHERSVPRIVSRLVAKGVVVVVSQGRGRGRPTVYFLPALCGRIAPDADALPAFAKGDDIRSPIRKVTARGHPLRREKVTESTLKGDREHPEKVTGPSLKCAGRGYEEAEDAHSLAAQGATNAPSAGHVSDTERIWHESMVALGVREPNDQRGSDRRAGA